ncbi:MAG: hypothetical protein AAFN50_05925, partial [Pseudomonadota bacterium]
GRRGLSYTACDTSLAQSTSGFNVDQAILPVDGGYPLHKGCRLQLLDGPERLETGWWDDAGISRDYYTAVNGAGTYLWVFRSRRTPAWYLHGIFG